MRDLDSKPFEHSVGNSLGACLFTSGEFVGSCFINIPFSLLGQFTCASSLLSGSSLVHLPLLDCGRGDTELLSDLSDGQLTQGTLKLDGSS